MIKRLLELGQYRELISNLVIRDLKVRYRGSVLGFAWSLLNPLLLMLVFTVVFTVMMPNNTIPSFPVFLLTALLPWGCFNTSVMASTNSIVHNGHLINKVYFPREILPLTTVLSNFVNFLLSLPVLFVMILAFGLPIKAVALYLPLIMFTQLCFTLGISFILATVNVFYRDTAVIMEVIMQAWFFLTPIFYPIEILPASGVFLGITVPIRRMLYILNPMASIIASYRSVLYGFTNGSPPAAPALDFFGRTVVTSVIMLFAGYAIFIRSSRRFGEEV